MDKTGLIIPQLDARYELPAGGAVHPLASTPRLPVPALAGHDWHNDYAALAFDPQERLRNLPDDQARERLLEALRITLAEAPARRA